jgi:hypothetical protein
MQSGFISLSPIYDFLRSNPDPKGLERGSPVRRGYGLAAKGICAEIAPAQDSYQCGQYEADGLWRNIYLGKAGFG